MEGDVLARKGIIEKIVKDAEALICVNAVWEMGSAAYGRVDKWSDIDLFFDVDENYFEKTFETVEESLVELSEILYKYEKDITLVTGDAVQRSYRLKDTSEFNLVQINLISAEESNKLSQKEIYGDIKIYFDKRNVLTELHVDLEEFLPKIVKRYQDIGVMFEMFQYMTKKEINRGHYVEAMGYYYKYSVGLLLEILRMRYYPFRYDFGIKYLYIDLPEKVSSKIEKLFPASDINELMKNEIKVIK